MEKAQKLIIDGYNLIHADEGLRRTACKDLQGAREKLIELLKQYLKGRRVQITVVFDGHGGLANAESVVPGKLQALFSAGEETADELIIATVRRSSSPRSFVVVSSDMAHIGRTARSMGCEVIGSKRFLDRLVAGESRTGDGGRTKTRGDLGDTDYWLKRFGEKGENADDTE
jgi:predicted RNA-binding protein with PIN domain